MPSPGPFKGADDDPEATLELFEDYLDKMEKVYRLSRGYNPVTGVKVDWNSEEKKDLLLVEGPGAGLGISQEQASASPRSRPRRGLPIRRTGRARR